MSNKNGINEQWLYWKYLGSMYGIILFNMMYHNIVYNSFCALNWRSETAFVGLVPYYNNTLFSGSQDMWGHQFGVCTEKQF